MTPLKTQEIVQSYISALKGQAANSTGTEREHLSAVADDLSTKAAAFTQKWGKSKGLVKYQDEPLIKDLLDSVDEIHGEIGHSLEGRLNTLARTSRLPSVNNVIQTAKQDLLGQYKAKDKEAPAPAGQAPAKAPDQEIQAKVNAAKQAGYSDEEIAAYLKGQ